MEKRIKNQIIQALATHPQTIYELIPKQDASLRELTQIVRELESDNLLLYQGDKLELNQDRLAGEDLEKIRDLQGEQDQGHTTSHSLPGQFQTILRQLEQICNDRPRAVEEYDQGFISTPGVVERARFMFQRGDLWGSRILILGDDDLLGLALGLTGLPAYIKVLEIDQRLNSFINSQASKLDLPLVAETFDVQYPLDKSLQQDFDCFLTDPVETLPGFQLFLSRGVSSLQGPGSSAYFGLTTLEASRNKWYEIQNSIMDMGFVITDLLRNFNVYPQQEDSFARYQEKTPIYKQFKVEPATDWYMSSFYRIEAVKQPVPLIEQEMVLEERFYKDEESLATPF
ncbi:MAG: bis-aminopropyl spermidine synthase family protein [Thermodesulfobacteriota bacterium]